MVLAKLKIAKMHKNSYKRTVTVLCSADLTLCPWKWGQGQQAILNLALIEDHPHVQDQSPRANSSQIIMSTVQFM